MLLSPTPAPLAPARLTARVRGYIERHYAAPISLRDVARDLGYSPAHLTYVFRRETGSPVTASIIERRISAARDLLRRSTASVEDVCEHVGFRDLRYFTRQFARHVGLTPCRYRESVSGGTVPAVACASAMALFSDHAAPIAANPSSSDSS